MDDRPDAPADPAGEVLLHVVHPDEWPAHHALRLEMLLDSPDAFWTAHHEAVALEESQWRQRLGSTCHVMATINGAPVGSVGLWAGDDSAPDVAHLIAMYVAPRARGRHVGERLVVAVLGEAVRRGLGTVLLEVTSNNAPARALYERAGFRPTGRRSPHPRRPDLDEREMVWTAPGPGASR